MKRTDKNRALQKPSSTPLSAELRAKQIGQIAAGFVAKGKANRDIYKVLIECLLPQGAGVPGPIVSREELRLAVETIKPGYQDVFRRVRELQGEEGLTGLIQNGVNYQLISLAVGAKRVPRQPISKHQKQEILDRQGYRCAVCGTPLNIGSVEKFDPDHRIPRLRGGTNNLENYQGLCPACNNNKSSQCSNCTEPCNICSWAFPERFRSPRVRQDLVEKLSDLAKERNRDFNEFVNEVLTDSISRMTKH